MLRWPLYRRSILAAVLATLLTAAPSLVPQASVTVIPGAAVARAQGGMDIGILSPSFSELPQAVVPGQEFAINAVTVPGASCAGWIAFRGQPVIELEAQAAPSGTCSWTVAVPLTARAGTANIGVGISRNGQQWALYGVTYVVPVGERR